MLLPRLDTKMYLPDKAPDPYSLMRTMVDQLEAAARKADEAKALGALNEARVDLIMGGHNWLTALAFAKRHGLDTSKPSLQRLGAVAATNARVLGIEPTRVPNSKYGRINSLPEEFWMSAAKQLGLLDALETRTQS